MPSQDEVNNFQAIIGRLAALAGDTAANIMHVIHEEEQADVYAATVGPLTDASSLITAEWYDSLAPDAPFAVAPAPPADPETLRYKAGWAATEDDPAGALQGATERLVYGASRDTVVENAEREGVSYARHASEDACAWCRLLATRGAVYHSAETAAASHDYCQCVAVPNRYPDLYLEPDYVDTWRKQYEKALEEVGPAIKKNQDAIINHMRRARHAEDPERDNLGQRDYYQQNKDEINRRARKAYANKKTLI